MGWGTKKAQAPRPEPESAQEIKAFAGAISETVPEPKPDARAIAVAMVESARDLTKSDGHKAQLEWHHLKSRKGWTDATQAMLLYEFVQSRQLFAELVKFARRR
jgi:hypothetical protein